MGLIQELPELWDWPERCWLEMRGRQECLGQHLSCFTAMSLFPVLSFTLVLFKVHYVHLLVLYELLLS